MSPNTSLREAYRQSNRSEAIQKAITLILGDIFVSFLLLIAFACSSQEKVTAPKGISLSDAHQVLDITEAMPNNFVRIDAALAGYSKKDLGLGNNNSEVEFYAMKEPNGIIYAYLSISEKRTRKQQSDADAFWKDDEQVKYFFQESVKASSRNEGKEVEVSNMEVTHPAIGDMAVDVGCMVTDRGIKSSSHSFIFRVGSIYVYIHSRYSSSEKLSFVPIAREIEQNIASLVR